MNQRRLVFRIVLFFALLSFGFLRAQEDPLKDLIEKLESYKAKNNYEKVHLHTDKPYYAIGDTIWFKAYVVLGEKNRLSAISKFLYVDLINEKDSLKRSLKLNVVNGMAHGDFVLGDSLAEGNYRLRAYTTWMRNYGEEFFFDKTFAVGNVLSNKVVSSVSYKFSKTGIRENVIADITYNDINGAPLVNREVSYAVQLDYRNLLTGKATTNESGTIQVKFTNAQPFVLKSGKLNTSIRLSENSRANKNFPIKSTSADADVQFFPEGGNLINNFPCKVGFKAVGADGVSRDVSGYIVDNSNNRIAEFRSEHAGMGTFSITPLAQKNYKAVVTFEDGSEKQVDLPKAQAYGYALKVNASDPDSLQVKVFASENLLNKGELTLVFTTNGEVNYVTKNKLENSAFVGKIAKKRFPTGILQVTLFSPDYQPVAERLSFIYHPTLSLDIKSDKASYQKHQKVSLDLTALDSLKAVTGLFSMAVVNESMVPFDETNETTILSNLLLSSDIKGYIEKPNYYFTEPRTAQKEQHLDNLLLTQGWRRYTWNSIIKNTYPILSYEPETDITIRGRVVNANGSVAPGARITLLPARGNGVIMDTLTNAEGRFVFPGLRFNDSTSFVIQARSAKGKKNVYIELDQLPAELVGKNKNAAALELNVNQSMITYLKNRDVDFEKMRKSGLLRKSILLAEVKVADKKPILTNSSNLNGAGNADAVIKADKLQNCLSLPQCLQGMVAGIIIQNGIAYSTRSMYSSFSGLVPMQLIIDGMYVDPTYLSIIPPQDVESIEVLRSGGNTAIYGIRGGGGVLIINTKRGERNLAYQRMSPGIATYKPQGISSPRQFYSPVYTTPQPTAALPDLRNTIYWQPSIITDAKGKAEVSFYTADEAGTYKVVVEGLTLSGSLVRKVYRFMVL